MASVKSKKKMSIKKGKPVKSLMNQIFTPLETMYLAMLSFVFISSFALCVAQDITSKRLVQEINNYQESYILQKQFPAIPRLKMEIVTFPLISSQAALAIDLDSMTTLYEKNPDGKLLPASTTKIVTALVAFEHFSEDAILKVGPEVVDGQSMGLVAGEEISAKSLFEGLLIKSANDAAETLAENFPGGRDAFISAMNNKAKDLNLENTNFENPTGFDGVSHFSTARDLTRVGIIAMNNPKFSEIVKKQDSSVASIDGKIVHKLVNTNKLLGNVEGVLGVKTGWTENARENLVTYIERDGKSIMIAILGSQDRFGETEELINWILESYEWQEVNYKEVY